MQIGIATNDRLVYCGKSLQSISIQKPETLAPNRNWFKLMPGKIDIEDIEGTDVLILGEKYVIGNRKYPLEGYAISARLTPEFTLVPHLRLAVGKEVKIHKAAYKNKLPEAMQNWPAAELDALMTEKGIEDNPFWPVIVKCSVSERSNSIIPPLVQQALEEEVTETTNLTDMVEAMMNSEAPEDPFLD
jgi:hypothetical protein